jgi:7-cyano-7-deazaguanine synthase
MTPKALVILSGGQDSTTCLFWALHQGWEVHAISFDYGQRHAIELQSAVVVGRMAGVKSHRIVDIKGILSKTGQLFEDEVEALDQYLDGILPDCGIEKTFVPMRNQTFLTIAANHAYVLGADYLVTGVCQADNGGYPDCREDFIDLVEASFNAGTFTGEDHLREPITICTPLMHLSKAESVLMANELPGCMQALAYTHTAYDGQYPPVSMDHANLLRAKGFEEAGLPDPLVVRAASEGRMELPDTANYDLIRRPN